MLLAALPGLGVGVAALTVLSKEALQVTVGIAVMLAAGWQLRQRSAGAVERSSVPPAVGWAAGFVSGVLTTSISISGPPIVLWLEAHRVRPEQFRASLAASFLALNVTGGAVLLAAEGSGALDAGVIAPLLGLVVAGYVLGTAAFRRLDRERFFTAVLALVACTGAASLAAGVGIL